MWILPKRWPCLDINWKMITIQNILQETPTSPTHTHVYICTDVSCRQLQTTHLTDVVCTHHKKQKIHFTSNSMVKTTYSKAHLGPCWLTLLLLVTAFPKERKRRNKSINNKIISITSLECTWHCGSCFDKLTTPHGLGFCLRQCLLKRLR